MTKHKGPYCGGKLHQGEGTCTQPAGWGTDHVGHGRCKLHGGGTPNARKAAFEAAITEQAAKYVAGGRPITDPLTALLQLAGEIHAFKDFLGQRVAEMRADQWRYAGEHAEQVRAEVSLYERALDRTAKILVDISRLGIEERRLRLTKLQADLMIAALTRIFERLELTPQQKTLTGVVVPEELRRVSRGEPTQ